MEFHFNSLNIFHPFTNWIDFWRKSKGKNQIEINKGRESKEREIFTIQKMPLKHCLNFIYHCLDWTSFSTAAVVVVPHEPRYVKQRDLKCTINEVIGLKEDISKLECCAFNQRVCVHVVFRAGYVLVCVSVCALRFAVIAKIKLGICVRVFLFVKGSVVCSVFGARIQLDLCYICAILLAKRIDP